MRAVIQARANAPSPMYWALRLCVFFCLTLDGGAVFGAQGTPGFTARACPGRGPVVLWPDGDERSPIRGDTLRVAVVGYAATGPMLIDEPTGALLFGANTAANRKRFWEASRVYHHLELTNSKTGRYVTLGHAPANGRVVSLGAPFWWRGKGEGHRWSLTGRLLGPRFDNRRGSGGRGRSTEETKSTWST